MATISQIKLPDNSTYNINVPFVIGTGSTAGTWLGTLNALTAYYDGLLILYKPSVAGASTTTLNLNSIGAKTVYLNSSTKLTTHFPANQPILLVYSSSTNSGCWVAVDNYDSGNTNTQVRVYRQTTGYNADYPIIVSRTQTIGTAGTDSSYTGVYGVVHDTTQQPTVNPSTGELKAKKLNGDITGNALTSSQVTTALGYTPYDSTNPNGYTSNTGTVTKVSTGVGLTGGDVTTTGTIKAKLKSETASTLDSTAMGSTASRQYAVGVDKSGYLSVNIPWTDHYAWSDITSKPTTISGYGITDAKIASGVITLGSNTITPLTSASTLDATKLSGTIPSGCYTDTKNTAGSTDTSSKIFLIGATSQAANPQTYSDNQCYVTSGTLTTANTVATIFGVSASDGTSGGISLYSGTGSVDNYGIAFRKTTNKEKHGYVQSDWATYFTMNSGATTRGWIYRLNQTDGNVASISGAGNLVLNGSVTIGGNTTNTSGARMQYNSTLNCIDFVFAS